MRTVKNQRLRDSASTESYWDWALKNNPMNDDGEVQESAQANPDVLSDESEVPFPQRGPIETKALQILERALETLNPYKRDAWVRYMRLGETQQEIADSMGKAQQTINDWLRDSQKQIEKFCKAHESELDAVIEEESDGY